MALQVIGSKMMVGSGRPMSRHLSQVIDRLLGTEVEADVDREKEEEAFSAMANKEDDASGG
jgi:hypothetical protein